MATTDSSFKFPHLYHFPAFYTQQPTIATREAQLRAWSDLILSYCRHHRLWRLSVVDAIDTPLFHNPKLKKRLSLADAREVLDWMSRKEGGERVEWVGKEGQKAVCWVYWRRPEEWAGVLSDWVGYHFHFHHLCLSQVFDWLPRKGRRNRPKECRAHIIRTYGWRDNVIPRYAGPGQNVVYRAHVQVDFHGIDPEILQRSLNILVKRGKAQVFGTEDQQGVKFF